MTKASQNHDNALMVRITDDMLKDLETEQKQIEMRTPGIRVTLSDVIRMRLMRGKEVAA